MDDSFVEYRLSTSKRLCFLIYFMCPEKAVGYIKFEMTTECNRSLSHED